jgi:hypothetical protein
MSVCGMKGPLTSELRTRSVPGKQVPVAVTCSHRSTVTVTVAWRRHGRAGLRRTVKARI